MTERPRVLIADDHPLVAQGIKALLTPYCDVIALVEDARQIEAALEDHRPDLLLLDLSMPHRNGLELLPELRRRFPALRILVVTMHLDRALAELAFESGATGFVPKEATAEELYEAVTHVMRGQRFLSGRVPRRGYRDTETVDHQVLDRLTPRQREILRLLGDGKSSADIGVALGVSPRTVEFHRAGIRRALGITSEWGLQRFAIMIRLQDQGTHLPPDGEPPA